MIYEGVVATRNEDGTCHLSPMGFQMEAELVVLAPFAPSQTLENIRRERVAILNLTDNVEIIAGCLTGLREWPMVATAEVPGWRLVDALEHKELRLFRTREDETRPTFYFQTVNQCSHQAFSGFNRAQAAVVEAAILLTRLDWLAPEKVTSEIGYLSIAVEKTAGPRELRAWDRIINAIDAHERHDLSNTVNG